METNRNSVNDRLHTLAREILVDRPRPTDHWEIAILLEISGRKDEQLLSETNSKDIFDLAKKLYVVMEEDGIIFEDKVLEERKKKPFVLFRFIRYYTKGLFFAMPMAVQIFAMLILQYSLWAWMYFSVHEATAVALGTIGSFIITGGFTQIIGRKGTFYTVQDENILTMKVSYLFLLIGVITVVVVGMIFLFIWLIFRFLPGWMIQYIVIYYFFLAFLWLSFAILYMLRRTGLCTLIVAIGIIFVHLIMFFEYRLPIFKGRLIIWAHIIGLSVAIILALLSGYIILREKAKKSEEKFRKRELPKLSILIYSVMAYFFYGFLYFLFLCLDRLVSWSCHKELVPYIITFRVPYELGMDWALLSLILTMAALEDSVEAFFQTIIPVQYRLSVKDYSRFNAYYIRFYLRTIIFFIVITIVSVIFVYLGMFVLSKWNQRWEIFYGIEHFFNPITYFVFFMASIGYGFMVLGLFNSTLFFTLSRPNFVIKAIIIGLVVNFVVGFICSRLFGYYWGVLGLTCGALVFMLITNFYASRVLRRLDYYYYSAF